jgi:hypothetical protein
LCIKGNSTSEQLAFIDEIIDLATKSYRSNITLNLLSTDILCASINPIIKTEVTDKLINISRTNQYIFNLFLEEVDYQTLVNTQNSRNNNYQRDDSCIPPHLMKFLEMNLYNKHCLKRLIKIFGYSDSLRDKVLDNCTTIKDDQEYLYIAYE